MRAISNVVGRFRNFSKSFVLEPQTYPALQNPASSGCALAAGRSRLPVATADKTPFALKSSTIIIDSFSRCAKHSERFVGVPAKIGHEDEKPRWDGLPALRNQQKELDGAWKKGVIMARIQSDFVTRSLLRRRGRCSRPDTLKRQTTMLRKTACHCSPKKVKRVFQDESGRFTTTRTRLAPDL